MHNMIKILGFILILSLGSEAMAWDNCFCYKNRQPMVVTQQMVAVPYYTYQVVPVYIPVVYYPVVPVEHRVVTVQNVLVPVSSYIPTPMVNYPVHGIYKY